MEAEVSNRELCYIKASHVHSPAGKLEAMEMHDMHDRLLGSIDGVLVDPAQRRLRYFVVEPPSSLDCRQYLVPMEWPAQVERTRQSLKVAMEDELTDCDEFDAQAVRAFSDDDFLAMLFGHNA